MNHIDELNHKFSEERESLARIDVDLSLAETALLHTEKSSLEWFQHLANLNALNQKRQIIVSRLADLRVTIEKEKVLVI